MSFEVFMQVWCLQKSKLWWKQGRKAKTEQFAPPHFSNCWEHFDHFLKFISCVLYLVSKLGKSGVHSFKRCSIWIWNGKVMAVWRWLCKPWAEMLHLHFANVGHIFEALFGAQIMHTISRFKSWEVRSPALQTVCDLEVKWRSYGHLKKTAPSWRVISKWFRNSTYEFEIHFEMTPISNSPTATWMFHLLYLGNCI